MSEEKAVSNPGLAHAGKLLMVVGAIVLAIGIIMYVSNQPVNLGRSGNLFGAVSDMGENLRRAENRQNSVTVDIIGGVIIIAGFVMFSTGNRSQTASEISSPTANNIDSRQSAATTTCPNCGKVYDGDLSGKFCENCGTAL